MARRVRRQTASDFQLSPSPRASTSDTVFEALRQAILARDLPGGTPLIEVELAQQFQVSKTPIREALQRLTHSGLVDYELARGATVHTLTAEEIQDVFEMRVLLEPLAVRQSIPRLTQEDYSLFEETLNQAKIALEVGNFRELSALNSKFHNCLYQRTTNHLLLRWLDSLSDLRRLITMHGWALENCSEREWDEHRGIFEATQAGNIDLAVERLTQHITRFSVLVLEHMAKSEKETEQA